jgi:cytochrome c peroxidase
MPAKERTHPAWPAPHRSYPAAAAVLATVATLAALLLLTGEAAAQESSALGSDFLQAGGGNIFGPFLDRTGSFRNATNNSSIANPNNSFFDPSLGTNGQACVTCHQPSQGFSVTPEFIRLRFATTQGLDPLFRATDTADRPDADLSSPQARREAFDLFRDLGVVRIGKTLPATAEFSVVPQNTPRFGPLPNPHDPQSDGAPTLSLFRRSIATTNTRFQSVVLWDGRQNIHDLRTQVKAAARTLMLGRNVSDAQADNAALFMTSVFTAQDVDFHAGSLSAAGARGGVDNLKNLATSPQAPCLPLTDPAQATSVPPVTPPPTGCIAPTRPFDLFTAWQNLPRTTEFRPGRASVARGEQIFNTRQFTFPGLPGTFACTACHTTTDIGNFPFVAPVNTAPNASLFVRYGLDSPEFLAHLKSRDARMASFVERTAKLPVYTISLNVPQAEIGSRCGPAILPRLDTGQPILESLTHSTDPGRAMVTGLCTDLGGFKPPILRGLAMRGPFFHNGAAETLEDVVNFYDVLLRANFTQQDREDLLAFLRAL